MPIFPRLDVRALWRPQSINDLDNQMDTATSGVPTFTGVNVSENLAMNYTAHYACTKVLSETMSSLPLQLKQRKKDGGARDAEELPLYYLLNKQPSEESTSVDFIGAAMVHECGWGNTYAFIDVATRGRNAGHISQLVTMLPDRTRPFRDANGRIKYEYKRRNADGSYTTLIYDRSQVLHIPGFSYDGLIGYSPVSCARQAIGLGMALEEFVGRFFGNGAHVKGVIMTPEMKDKTAVDRFRESVKEAYAGLQKAHQFMVLPGATDFKAFTMSLDDAELLASRKFSLEEMCRIHRVPPHMVSNLEKATFCLPADATVFTVAGPKPIVEVHAGDLVWSKSNDGAWVQAKVERSECTGEDEVLTIKCRNRTLRCNAKHRVAVRRERYEPYGGGRGTYSVVDGKKVRKTYGVEWVDAGSLKVGDTLIGITALPEMQGASCPTRERVTPEFMEALGLLLGDGFYFRGRGGKGAGFGFSHGENDEHVAYYTTAIEKEFRQFDGAYGRKNGGTRPLVGKERDKNTTVFYSGMAYDELEACGIVGNAWTKRVPEWVFGLTNELKLAFVRGYLDADGTVSKNGQIRFASVNKDLLDDFRHLCMSLGIPVGNIFHADIKSHFNGKSYQHRLYGFMCANREINQRIGSHIAMYRERMVKGADSKRKRRTPIYPNEAKLHELGEGLQATGILSIERGPTEPVYDLCVEGSHNFVANGCYVHNSNIEHQSLEFSMFTMTPWVRRWEQRLDMHLLSESEKRAGYFAKFNMRGLMRGDMKSQGEAFKLLREVGAYNPNRILELLDENPRTDPGGEQYWDEGPSGQGQQAKQQQAQAMLRARLEPVLADCKNRIERRQEDVIEQSARYAKKGDVEGMKAWLNGFYQRHESDAKGILDAYFAALNEPERATKEAQTVVETLKMSLESVDILDAKAVEVAIKGCDAA